MVLSGFGTTRPTTWPGQIERGIDNLRWSNKSTGLVSTFVIDTLNGKPVVIYFRQYPLDLRNILLLILAQNNEKKWPN